MYDAGKILVGLVVFVGLVVSPAWYTAAHHKLSHVPDLQKPVEGKQCVESTPFMRAKHMNLLDEWRDSVVRDGMHSYTASDGRTYEMSLEKTCLHCHTEPAKFCNRCHEYLAVQPSCWNCHQQPKGTSL